MSDGSQKAFADAIAGHGLAAPSPDEAALVSRVAGLLVAEGLKLPRYDVGWFRPSPINEVLLDGLLGRTFNARRPVVVLIRAGLARQDLIQVIIHELQHVADAPYTHLTKDELETRAEQLEADWTPVILRKLGTPKPELPRGTSAPSSRAVSVPTNVFLSR